MESSDKLKKADKKVARKLHKKTLNLLKDVVEDIEISLQPTQHLFIGNAGLMNGVARESLILLFSDYGLLIDLTMVPQKSFAFISYSVVESAKKAVAALTGYNILSKENLPPAPLYFSYLNKKFELPNKHTQLYPNECRQQVKIDGLVLMTNYISEIYAKELFDYFYCKEDDGMLFIFI